MSHATDLLDATVALYYSKGFKIVCLTEHMPRLHDQFLYPEELEKHYTTDNLVSDFQAFTNHAKRLQQEYKDKMKIIIGFEVEGIDIPHIEYSQELIAKNNEIQMMVGSVHFVHQIPIDFTVELWKEARSKSRTTRGLYCDYFDLQYRVITSLKPMVVGHFDLIRLLQPEDDFDSTTGKLTRDVNVEIDWPEVWERIVRNIKVVYEYGGLFELNSSAIRKGWDTPYPRRDIAEAIIKYGGGRFCLSDDSHALTQVGLNYHKVLEYLKSLNVDEIYHLDLDDDNELKVRTEDINILERSTFWDQYK